MSEPALFWTRCLKILTVNLTQNVQSHFKLRHQAASTSSSTSFLTPPPPLHNHPLPLSSALANAHMWANPGQPGQPQQSQAPPPHHLSAATPTLPASSTTMKTTTMTREGWKSVRRMGRRGTGGQKDDDDAVCNPHTVSSIPFLFSFPSFCLTMQCATHTLCC